MTVRDDAASANARGEADELAGASWGLDARGAQSPRGRRTAGTAQHRRCGRDGEGE